ncbi:MAG: hypothetical protein SFV15_16165 [Polyangiaceae bacterium]|nr:hypothetical protein [Polyangiaceae bacterium]
MVAAVLSLQSCSIVFSEPAPRAPEAEKPPRCGVRLGLAVADLGFVGLATSVATADLVGNNVRKDRATALLADGAVAALFLASAVYGLSEAEECRATFAPKEAPEREGPRAQPSSTYRSTHVPSPSTSAEPQYAAPSGGAGFVFGESPEQALARCSRNGGAWSTDEGAATCTWLRDQNSVRVQLNFCPVPSNPAAPALCRVLFETSPQTTDASVWRRLVTSLQGQLRRRFGPTHDQKVRYPESCKATASFYQCLVDGQIAFRELWGWKDGHRVTLVMDKGGNPGQPSVRISYESGAFAQTASHDLPEGPTP